MNAAVELLSRIVAVPSPSRDEAKVSELLERELKALGLLVARHGLNLVSRITGKNSGKTPGKRLMLCTHMDTVPANPGYTRDPLKPEVKDGKLYGLGANDAGAAIVSMIFAVKEMSQRNDWSGTLELALVVEEEVNGKNGAEALVREIGLPDAAIVGEPTALEICTAQKGLVVVDCVNHGHACHAANAYRLPHVNAIYEALPDIAAVAKIQFSERDLSLGPTTLNVTQIKSGVAHNSIPDRCEWVVDCRVNPAQKLEDIPAAIKKAVKADVAPRSLRLHPFRTPESAAIVSAARRARPQAKTYGSDAMSDAVFLSAVPVIKCGPGETELSHKPDEHVELHWIPEGIAFYRDAALAYFAG